MKFKLKEFIKNNKINFIFLAYIILAFIIMLCHESWRDESQAWLIGRDLSFFDIIKQMKYEGHPPVWYFIIAPFAKLGFPYITIKFISFIITSISVYLILKKSPFNIIIKSLLIFSSTFLYYYPAIARSYCLIPLAISLISIIYEKRKDKCIQYILSIVLLANTHIIMLGLVGMLLLFFFIEQYNDRKSNTKSQNKKIIISLLLSIFLLFISALPIWSSLRNNTDVNSSFNIKMIQGFPIQIKRSLFLLFGKEDNIFIIASIIILMIYEAKYYKKSLIIIIPSIVYQLLIYTFIYSNSYQRVGSFLLIILCVCWIQKSKKEIREIEKKIVEFIVSFLIIMNIFWGSNQIKDEIFKNYSNAEQTASYIKENIPEGKFICHNIAYASALIPYLNQDYLFWNPQSEEYFTFVTWDENYIQRYNLDELKEKIRKNFSEDENLYLINVNWNQDLKDQLQEKNEITKIYKSDDSIRGENFEIYLINKKFFR